MISKPCRIILFILLFSSSAWSFPELGRFQYNNCMACHVSPSGGGLLTSYGRSLSSEVLSTWGTEQEAGFLHGLIDREKLEKWVLVGGDIRSVQVYQNDSLAKTARFVNMQTEFSLGLQRERWALVTQFGGETLSFYGMYKFRDELSLRVGKVTPQFGIYSMDHNLFTRSFLGFALESQRPTVEIQWTDEAWSASASYSKNQKMEEVGLTSQLQYIFSQTYKVAFNYWHGTSPSFRRDIYGLWTLLGFSQNFYLNAEIDYQNKKIENTTNTATESLVSNAKLGYRFYKGIDGLLLYDRLSSDLHLGNKYVERYGIGFQFYPRPHFEVTGAWTKQLNTHVSNKEVDYAWLLLHYYL